MKGEKKKEEYWPMMDDGMEDLKEAGPPTDFWVWMIVFAAGAFFLARALVL